MDVGKLKKKKEEEEEEKNPKGNSSVEHRASPKKHTSEHKEKKKKGEKIHHIKSKSKKRDVDSNDKDVLAKPFSKKCHDEEPIVSHEDHKRSLNNSSQKEHNPPLAHRNRRHGSHSSRSPQPHHRPVNKSPIRRRSSRSPIRRRSHSRSRTPPRNRQEHRRRTSRSPGRRQAPSAVPKPRRSASEMAALREQMSADAKERDTERIQRYEAHKVEKARLEAEEVANKATHGASFLKGMTLAHVASTSVEEGVHRKANSRQRGGLDEGFFHRG